MTDISVPLVKVGMPPKDLLMPALQAVLYSGMIAEGEYVYRFEEEFAKAFGLPGMLAMSSGTAALHASLILAGVTPGSEVITTSMTAEPTNLVILQAGGIPVFADVDASSGNLSPESVERLITSRTRAVVVVHYAGFPARISALRAVCDKVGVALIEDCAHALGARADSDRPIGTVGDFSIFSFQAIKHMTTVDGGALWIKDQGLLGRARKIRWFGMEKGVPRTEVDITELGYKYNMSNVTAAIGLAQLRVIQDRLAVHIDNGRYFDDEISAIPGLNVTRFEATACPSYWLYTVLSDDWRGLVSRLKAIGVAASKLHRPNHLHSLFAACRIESVGLQRYHERMVHIPCGWWVDKATRERIVHELRKG